MITALLLVLGATLNVTAAVSGAPAPLVGDDLDSLIVHALTHHPALQAAVSDQDAAAGRVRQAGSLPDPQFMWGEMVEGPDERMLSLTQPLPWPGTLGARRDAAASLARGADAGRRATAVQITAEVRRAWAQAAWLGETTSVLSRQRDLAQSLTVSVRAGYEAGQGRYGDLLLAQLEVARREDLLAGLQEDLHQARSRLNAALGRRPDAPLTLPQRLPAAAAWLQPPAADPAHPQLELVARQADAARHDARAARRAGLPALSLGVDWIRMDDQGMAGASGGSDAVRARLGLSLPLWRGKYDGAAASAEARARAAESRHQDLAQDLAAGVAVAEAALRDARRRADLHEQELLPLARQSYETVLAAYRAEGAGFAEVLAAQRTLLDLEQSLLAIRRDALLAAADLEAALGRVPVLHHDDLEPRSGS
jgi:outer membrane protein, heavy metal efflux system